MYSIISMDCSVSKLVYKKVIIYIYKEEESISY